MGSPLSCCVLHPRVSPRVGMDVSRALLSWAIAHHLPIHHITQPHPITWPHNQPHCTTTSHSNHITFHPIPLHHITSLHIRSHDIASNGNSLFGLEGFPLWNFCSRLSRELLVCSYTVYCMNRYKYIYNVYTVFFCYILLPMPEMSISTSQMEGKLHRVYTRTFWSKLATFLKAIFRVCISFRTLKHS